MSNRKITKEQFEEGVVIDSNAIDNYLEDATNRFNFLPATDDKSSWFQQQLVFGYTERDTNFVPSGTSTGLLEAPWLPARDANVEFPSGSLRMKGINSKATGVNLQVAAGGKYCSNGYQWQVSFWTDEPIVVTDYDMWFQCDELSGNPQAPFSDDWRWAAVGPVDTIQSGSYVQDFVVQMEIDHPLNASQPQTTAVELQKSQIYADAQFAAATTDWDSDMLPNMLVPGAGSGQKAWGVAVSCRNVNVPVAAKSRVRLNIFIPNWDTSSTVSTGDVRWKNATSTPWRLQQYNGTLTFLERKK